MERRPVKLATFNINNVRKRILLSLQLLEANDIGLRRFHGENDEP
jgi:hypothetical protein